MPWIIYDPDDETYLSEELYGKGATDDLSDGLWQKDEKHATRFDTEQEALKAIEEIDVEDILLQIVPLWRDTPLPASSKRWEDMTFAEKMAQIEDDADTVHAARVQRAMVASPRRRKPIDPTRLQREVPPMTTGRLTSSKPAVQYIRRSPTPMRDPLYPIHGSASDMLLSASFQKQLVAICKDLPPILMAKAPPELTAAEITRQRVQTLENISYANRYEVGIDLALGVDYSAIEMRVFHQLKKRSNDGREEEEEFRLLYGDFLRGLGDEARAELPDGEGVQGDGGPSGGGDR